MSRWKKFPWRRLLAALAIAIALIIVAAPAEGETRYVGVAESNPDAAILDSPDWLGELLETLKVNEEVELTGEEQGDYVEITLQRGPRKVTGWVKANILRKRPLKAEGGLTESEGSEATAQAAKGFNEEIEQDMRNNSDEMNAWLDKVDRFEAARNEKLGGDPVNPDPRQVQERARRFGEDGKLIERE